MATWTLEEAQGQLTQWKAALTAVSTGVSYTIGGRSLTRANITDIKDMIKYFGDEIDKLERKENGHGVRKKVRRYLPLDL